MIITCVVYGASSQSSFIVHITKLRVKNDEDIFTDERFYLIFIVNFRLRAAYETHHTPYNHNYSRQ